MLPLSFAFPELKFGSNIVDIFKEFKLGNLEIESGVASIGDAAAYALVWEWGNTRQTKSGPKTVLGTNPKGKFVWLTSQQPFGYIRINEPVYWEIVNMVMREVNFNQTTSRGMQAALEKASRKIVKLAAQIIQDSAPIDTGDLRSSIKSINPGDSLLDQDSNEYETFLLGD